MFTNPLYNIPIWVFLVFTIIIILKYKSFSIALLTMCISQWSSSGGTSQNVKRLFKKSGIFTLYNLGFIDNLLFFLCGKLPWVLSIQRRVILCHVIADTKANLSNFKLGQKLFQFERNEIFKISNKNSRKFEFDCLVNAKIGCLYFCIL